MSRFDSDSVFIIDAHRRTPLWELTKKRSCSISGVELSGDNLARFIYADETGISDKDQMVLVAGVIIDPDKQWKYVAEYIDELIVRYVPKEHRRGFVFHAKDLFHGTGRSVFDRRTFPLERSREVLKKLIRIPRRFDLPIAWGFFPKRHPVAARLVPRKRQSLYHSLAYALCLIAAERFMHEYAPNEVATLIAENNTDTWKAVKDMHKILQGHPVKPSVAATGLFDVLSSFSPSYLPITQIVDSVHFADKDDAVLMQIADSCALILRYFEERKPNCDEFFEEIMGERFNEMRGHRLEGSAAGLRILQW